MQTFEKSRKLDADENSRISTEHPPPPPPPADTFNIGLNRPAKRNAFDRQMLDELAMAYAQMEDTPEIRCGVLYAEGEMFTAGLDLAAIAPTIAASGVLEYPENSIDPLNLYGERTRTKPIVAAVQGKCLTVGMNCCWQPMFGRFGNATFAQIEIKRGFSVRRGDSAFPKSPVGETQCAGC